MRNILLSVFVMCAPLTVVSAQEIHTSRPNPVLLPLPKRGDAFHFLIFGDRTGGPDSGLEVLQQAVTDANLLDLDLVMTVGNLLSSYNKPDKWKRDLEKYKAIMQGLRIPWFPVAGNHDVYWRGPPTIQATSPRPKH